jgi:excinuclease ABC subunit B
VKGDTIDVIPGYYHNIYRIEMFGDEIESIKEMNKVTGETVEVSIIFYFSCETFRHP